MFKWRPLQVIPTPGGRVTSSRQVFLPKVNIKERRQAMTAVLCPDPSLI